MASRMNFVTTSHGTTLRITDIPPEQNTFVHLYKHFLKFGDVSDLRATCNGDPKTATVTFDTREAAVAAFNSPEPLLNNRFIKVTWDSSTPAALSQSIIAPSPPTDDIKDRTCEQCNKIFASRVNRNRHVERIHTGIRIKCNNCSAVFSTPEAHQKHCIVFHATTAPTQTIAVPQTIASPQAIAESPKANNEPSNKIDQSWTTIDTTSTKSLNELIVSLRARIFTQKKRAQVNDRKSAEKLELAESKQQKLCVKLRGTILFPFIQLPMSDQTNSIIWFCILQIAKNV